MGGDLRNPRLQRRPPYFALQTLNVRRERSARSMEATFPVTNVSRYIGKLESGVRQIVWRVRQTVLRYRDPAGL